MNARSGLFCRLRPRSDIFPLNPGNKADRQHIQVRCHHRNFDNLPQLDFKFYRITITVCSLRTLKVTQQISALFNGHLRLFQGIVEKMAKDLGKSVSDLIGNKELLQSVDLNRYCTETIGLFTLKDIVQELEKPGLDTREKAKVFTFNQNIRSINDLHEGQLLPGIVNNITNFGCFVDIGIKESGLIHVSNLSDSFVKNVDQHVSLHEQIIVKVLDVDVPRKRIQLKLHK